MAENSPESRWLRLPNGRMAMPPLQREFLDWLLMDPAEKMAEASTQLEWARKHDVNPRTVREWKADHRFRAEWDRAAAEKNVSVEKVQDLLDMLHLKAVAGGPDAVQAAKLWLDHSRALRPPQKPVHEGDYSGLTDDELVAQIQSELNLGVADGG